MIPPELLCNQHLLGEHGEIHKHRSTFEKGVSIRGRVTPIVLIEPLAMSTRHDALAREMVLRGMNHQSPFSMPDLSHYSSDDLNVHANLIYNLIDLVARCPKCRERILSRYPHWESWLLDKVSPPQELVFQDDT